MRKFSNILIIIMIQIRQRFLQNTVLGVRFCTFSSSDKKPRQPRVTKEEMKASMLDDDYGGNTEIIQDGIADFVQEQRKIEDRRPLTDKVVQDRIAKLKQKGVTEYEISTILPRIKRKAHAYKNMLFFINVPIMFGIPIGLEMGMFASHAKINLIMALLQATDALLFLNTVLIYQVVQKLVTQIVYLPETNKVRVTQLSSMFLKEKTIELDPLDIVKYKRKSINPLLGYRTESTKLYMATEGIHEWKDREFFDSIIAKPKVRQPRPNKKSTSKKDEKPKKENENDQV